MPGTPTTKYAIPTLDGTTLARDIDTEVNAALSAIDDKMVGFSSGPLSSIPTSNPGSPGVAGRRYRANDGVNAGRLFEDSGTGWVELLSESHADELGLSIGTTVRRGKSIIATEQSRASTGYGTLTTPDAVDDIVLPTDGLLLVAYKAIWKESAVDAARAALFLNSNQLQIAHESALTPNTQAAKIGGSAGSFAPLTTFGGGLIAPPARSDEASADVTTGQIVGGASDFSDAASVELGGFVSSAPWVFGGFCLIYAAAGTYDVSVRFKATSGQTVTVKNRKLWVMALAF